MICVSGPKRLFTHIILEIEWMIVNSNTGRGQQYSNPQLLKKILAPICVRTQIEDVAFGGAGVARLEGKIVFVPLTVDGDEAEIGIVEKRKTYDRAELIKLLRSSAKRVEPLCPYFGRCGGCDYQHIAYEHQLEIKRRQVAELLRRVGGLTDPPVSSVIPCQNPYAFRNRITVHAEQGRIGFFAKNSRKVVDIERCEIAVAEVNEKLKELRRRGLRDGSHRTLRMESLPRTFMQTNQFIAAELLGYVSKHLKGRVLLDAYCGSGFFSRAFGDRFEKAVGVDWNNHAIAEAKAVAGPNEQYICADVGRAILALCAEHHPETVILDPPADGLEKQVVRVLADEKPQRVIYISCNPATLARDLSRLSPSFHVRAVQPFDMFPQTAEIEAAVVLDPIYPGTSAPSRIEW